MDRRTKATWRRLGSWGGAALLLLTFALAGCGRVATPDGQKETASDTAGGGTTTGQTGAATGAQSGSETTVDDRSGRPPKSTTATMRIDPAAWAIPIGGWKAVDGNQTVLDWPLENYLYRGPQPQLVRTAPGGTATVIHLLPGIPERLDYSPQGDKRVRYQLAPVSYWIDVQTVAIQNDGSMRSGGHDYGEMIYGSPDWAWKAEVQGFEYWGAGALLEKGTLIVSAGNQEAYRLERWLPYHRGSNSPTCAFGRPEAAWRPDGKYLAITAVPEPNVAELWVLNRETKTHTIATRLLNQKRSPAVTWSPDGRYLTHGSALLAMTPEGRVARSAISNELGPKLFWRSDSRYLLTSQSQTYRWGRLLLIEAETGKVQDLGYGWPLGFTAGGEALYVSWESSRRYPPDSCR